jgi:hypothetical protein
LPKLTAEVFNRPDCPEWAKYAAVDKSGVAFFYENKPIFTGTCYQSIIGATKIIDSSIKWDITNSQNILIERPATLPDWCKVGEWCYCLDDNGNGKYFKITKIKDNYIYGEDWNIDYHHIRQARLRPYNEDELLSLVGKVVSYPDKSRYFIISCADFCTNTPHIYFGETWHTAEEICNPSLYQLNGKPCGKLEHLENGVWLK